MLFDSGSQRSCITSSLKSRLGLSTSKMETVHLNTFGQDQFKKQSCEGVRLDLQSLDGDIVIQMKALAFPVIYVHLSQHDWTSTSFNTWRDLSLLIKSTGEVK